MQPRPMVETVRDEVLPRVRVPRRDGAVSSLMRESQRRPPGRPGSTPRNPRLIDGNPRPLDRNGRRLDGNAGPLDGNAGLLDGNARPLNESGPGGTGGRSPGWRCPRG